MEVGISHRLAASVRHERHFKLCAEIRSYHFPEVTLSNSRTKRLTEFLRLKASSLTSRNPTPLLKQGRLEGCGQLGSEYLQAQRLQHCSGKPVPVFCQSHSDFFSPLYEDELSWGLLCASCLLSCHWTP